MVAIPLRLEVTPKQECLQERASNIIIGGNQLKVLSAAGTELTVALSMTTPPAAAIEALKAAFPDATVEVYSPKPAASKVEVASVKLTTVDVLNVKVTADSVWNSVFKKPAPVFDRQHWAESSASDSYIYIPNCTRFKGEAAEDYNSNAMYTQIILAAYQATCRARKVNPLVRLQSGLEIPVLDLQAFHGSQTHKEAERAAGLANSVLVDYCDSGMGKEFLKQISLLDEGDFLTEPARQTVLAKAELILAGKSSHMYNQRFMKEFFDLMTINYADDLKDVFNSNGAQAQSSILNIFRGMIIDGFVLENSLEEFKSRMWAGGLGQYEEFISTIYSELINGQ